MLTAALIFIILFLIIGLVAIVIIWLNTNNQLKRYDQIDDVEQYKNACKAEAHSAKQSSAILQAEIATQKKQLQVYIESVGNIKSVAEAKQQLNHFQREIANAQKELSILDETASLQELGFYQRKFDFDHPDVYKQKMRQIVDEQKTMMKRKTACNCQTEWQVEGSAAKGRKMVDEQVKLMLRAFNGESDAAIAKVKFNNIETIEKRINKCFEALNKLGSTKQIFIDPHYLNLKLQELYLTHEHEIARQEEKDRQREIREQIREEQKAEKEIADAKAKAEKEEAAKTKALEAARKELAAEHGKHNEKLQLLVQKLELELKDAIDRKAKAIARAQLTRSGHVYVLSNVGTMGENVYKIGMTRRLEPLERVKELGGASVPFPFDVHAIIYSEDAPALESALHRRFDFKRVNLINTRKEFFNVTLKEIREAVADMHGLVTFQLTAEAEQYRETVAKRNTQMVEAKTA